MSSTCTNCGAQVSGKYCSNCGQKTAISRLNWQSILHPLLHFFSHVEDGFLKTTRELIVYPGRLFKNYLDGQRKRYHNPVTFLLIWIAIFVVLYRFMEYVTGFPALPVESAFFLDGETWRIYNNYRSIGDLLTLPLVALINWFIIARSRFNYVEILAIHFYTSAFGMMLVCSLLILLSLFNLNFHSSRFDLIDFSLLGLWYFFALYSFYRQFSIRYLVLRIIVACAVSLLVYLYLVLLFVRLFSYFNE